MEMIDPFVFRLSIFVLAIFVGYFVVWGVTPALHTPLMAVTNAISSVIVVGALIAVAVPVTQSINAEIVDSVSVSSASKEEKYDQIAKILAEAQKSGTTHIGFYGVDHYDAPSPANAWTSKALGFIALILASVNIFGGFLVTARMLAMYKKKDKK